MTIDFSQVITAEAKAAQAAADTQARYTSAIDTHVTATARSRGYNGAESLASYVASTVHVWAAEAAAFVRWRDGVWIYALNTLSEVQSGAVALPTLEEFLRGAPPMVWPE